jgi:hypothetical protein
VPSEFGNYVMVKREMADAQATFAVNTEDAEETVKAWPPWSWPPWGGDEDGDQNTPLDPATLASRVVIFERKLANATLDLFVTPVFRFCLWRSSNHIKIATN